MAIAGKRITQALREEIARLGRQTPRLSNRKIAKQLGMDKSTVAAYLERPPAVKAAKPAPAAEPVTAESDETREDKRTISLPRTRICSLEQLVEHCSIDLEVWRVDRFVCNKWEVGIKVDDGAKAHVEVEPLFQVKAFLSRRPEVDETRRIIARLWEKAKDYAPHYPEILIPKSGSGNVAEFAIVDLHLGAHIWGRETLEADYDLSIGVAGYKRAMLDLAAKVDGFKPERALLIFGNDQQNSDNRAGTTEAGTPQDNDTRYQKVFDTSADCSIWAVDECLQRYGAVDVVIVPGNHDRLSAWHLGRLLEAQYQNVPEVRIDNTPPTRKYWEYGVNMLLLTHGDKGKLESYDRTMAAERPSMWGRTRVREAHTGDKHHRKTVELPGATVRILSSLRPACAWSFENHFIGALRAADAFVWNHAEGLIGTATHTVFDGRVE